MAILFTLCFVVSVGCATWSGLLLTVMFTGLAPDLAIGLVADGRYGMWKSWWWLESGESKCDEVSIGHGTTASGR